MRPAVEIKVPVENVNDITARLLHWRAESGATVKEGDLLAEMETTKAVFEVRAPAGGVLQCSWQRDTEVPVGETLCRIWPDGMPTAAEGVAESASAPQPETATVFSKKARDLLAGSALREGDFAGVAFVTEADVRAKLGATGAEKTPPPLGTAVQEKAAQPATQSPKTAAAPTEPGELVPLPRAKLYENRELLSASRAVLRSTLHFLCPAAGLQDACARQRPPVNRIAILLFEAARLLAQFRTMNACFHSDSVFKYREVNIGFAVDMGHGLKVLVIRGADRLGFAELSAKVDDALVRYSTNSLAVADVTGSTFTVTDLSGNGVLAFDPLINTNQAAILGIGADQPGGFLLSCAFDHRINGGRAVAEFLGALSQRITAHCTSLAIEEKTCSLCLQPASVLRKRGHMLLASIDPPGSVCSICLAGN